MRLTRLPARRRALWMREGIVEEEDVAIMEILARLQRRYDAEDALTAARVLYDIEDSESEAEEAKGAPQQSYIHDRPAPTVPVTPSKPPRPPPELLRGLLEISLPSLSPGTSREDTSADSRLAAWLERIAQEQITLSRPREVVPQPGKEAILREQHHSQSAFSPLNAQEDHVDCSLLPPPALKFYPITPLSGRPRPTAQALFKRGRALSAPATPFSDLSIYSQPSPVRLKQVRFNISTGSDSSLNITLARTSNSSVAEASSNASGYTHSSDFITDAPPPLIPPLDFGSPEPSFIDVPWVQEPVTPADDNEFLEETSWSPRTPLHTTNDESLPNDAEHPIGSFPDTLPSAPLSSEFRAAFDSARDDDSFDRHVGALRDMSGIYATNLALQHTFKSPMLVRNWQRVIDELTGRSRKERLLIGRESELEMKFANQKETPRQDFDAHSTALAYDGHSAALGVDGTADISKSTSPIKIGAVVEPFSGPNLASSEFMPDASARESTPVHSFPNHKTLADRGLDREFIHYLRLNIARKRTEVELLKTLETQRLKVIHRLEKLLSRKTLELLTPETS